MKILLKIHNSLQKNVIPVAIIIILIPVIIMIILPYKTYKPWNFIGDSTSIPFTTNDNGYFYVRASFNDTTGLFFVDTGSDISCIKESLVNKNDSTYSKKIFDAQDISQRKKMVRVNNFRFGNIEFPSIHIWPMDIESWDTNGFLYKKDSVIGVIGSDLLSHFICEFNMEKREILIYKPDKYPSNLPDSISIPLLKKGSGYFTEIEIDSVKYSTKFDSGCDAPLVLKDTFSVSGKDFQMIGFNKKGNHKTFFSHDKNDTVLTEQSVSSIIPKLIFGIDTFESVICRERAKLNLLGVPFFWSFEKVIADYPNEKVYFLNKKKEFAEYGTWEHTINSIRNSYLNQHGTFKVNTESFLKHDILLITSHKTDSQIQIQDTASSYYKIYGESKWWGKSVNALDSIICLDSVQLPNGKFIYDDYKIYAKDKYFYDN